MHEKFASRGVVFLGVTSQSKEDIGDLKTFLEDNGVTWPNAYGAVNTMKELGVVYIPAVWVIGADGKVAWNSGEETKIEEALEQALSAAK